MFDLLEQSKQLFNGISFSYSETADNVHIEMSTSVSMLPSATELLNIINSISARDTLSIETESVVSFKYVTGNADWESSYNDFAEQCEPEDQADIKIHIKKFFPLTRFQYILLIRSGNTMELVMEKATSFLFSRTA